MNKSIFIISLILGLSCFASARFTSFGGSGVGGGTNPTSITGVNEFLGWNGSAYTVGAPSVTANANTANVALVANSISFTTVNAALNADALDGRDATYFMVNVNTVNAALNADTLDGIDSSAFLALGSDTWVSSRNTVYVTKNYYSGVTLSGTVEATAFKGLGTLITGTVNASLNSDTLDGIDGSAYMLAVGSDTWVSSKNAEYVTKNYYSGMTLNGTVEATAFKGLGTLIIGTVNASLNSDTLDGIDGAGYMLYRADNTWVSSANTTYVTKNYYSGVTLSGTVEATAFKGNAAELTNVSASMVVGTVNAATNADKLDGQHGSYYMVNTSTVNAALNADTLDGQNGSDYHDAAQLTGIFSSSETVNAQGVSTNAVLANEVIANAGITLGGVRNVAWPAGGGGGGSYSYKKTFLPNETKYPVIDTTVSGAALSVSSANLSVDVALFSATVTQGRLLMVDIPQNMTIVSFNILGRSDIQNTGIVNYWIYSRSVSVNASPGGAWTSVNLVICPAQTIQAADKWYKVTSGNVAIGNLGWTAGETFHVLFARGAGSNDDTMTVTSSVSVITVEMQ